MNGSNRIRLLQAKEQTAVVDIQQRSQKVVGYIRVFTEDQAATGHGLEVQERAIRSFCESQVPSSSTAFLTREFPGRSDRRIARDSGG